jgi:dihydrodipicolinate synthase/N-acetylneuraminate lyase
MVEGARHLQRNATVTETFEAVTPRMLAAATAGSGAEGGELVSIATLSGSGSAPSTKPSSAAVAVVGKMKTRQKEVGFQVMVGAADKLHASLEVGAVGAILAFACFAPTACYEIYAAWKEGDAELAQLKQERIVPASQYVIGGLGISGVKHAMDFNGYFGGPVRLPLLPLTGDAKAEVERLLADVRN